MFEDAFHAAETAKKAGFTVFGIYDDSNRENLSRMKDSVISILTEWISGWKIFRRNPKKNKIKNGDRALLIYG